MTNASKWEDKKQQPSSNAAKDIQYLFESFLEGNKIFHLIQPEHFDQLKLAINDETLHKALQERIHQVTGTNQHSLNLIWEAYLTNDPNNHLVQQDQWQKSKNS